MFLGERTTGVGSLRVDELTSRDIAEVQALDVNVTP